MVVKKTINSCTDCPLYINFICTHENAAPSKVQSIHNCPLKEKNLNVIYQLNVKYW